MKKLTVPLIVMLTVFSCFSQEKKYKTVKDRIFAEAQFIFEGKVIESTSFIDSVDSNMYSSYNIKIIKIFRGGKTINYGTIELIREGGWLPGKKWSDEKQQFPAPIPLPTGTPVNDGIFFCIASNYPPLNLAVDNSIKIQPIAQICNMGGFGRRFQSKQEIYDFLAQHENITIPPEPEKKKEEEKPQFTQAQLDSIHRADSTLKEENRKLYEQRKKNSDQYMQQLMERIKIAEENQKKKNAEGKKEDEE